ncbi:MAG TPA: hypothetical protein VFG76_11345 [Candidatus Polarisedimenticolia bacterium]|nr:hypothetical protein [Candidatus Polarisedimenticolia bacterium]
MEKMELLEDKIRRATEMIRSLREERDIMHEQLKSTRDEVKRLSMKKGDAETEGKLARLQEERQAIAQRIERMITIIEEVEAS